MYQKVTTTFGGL